VITGSNTYSGGTVVDAGGIMEVTTGASISHAAADFLIGRTADTATLSITGGSIVSGNGIIGNDGGGVACIGEGIVFKVVLVVLVDVDLAELDR
jgi:hypothetical protein